MNYISICKSNDPLNIFARAIGLNASRDRIWGGGGVSEVSEVSEDQVIFNNF